MNIPPSLHVSNASSVNFNDAYSVNYRFDQYKVKVLPDHPQILLGASPSLSPTQSLPSHPIMSSNSPLIKCFKCFGQNLPQICRVCGGNQLIGDSHPIFKAMSNILMKRRQGIVGDNTDSRSMKGQSKNFLGVQSLYGEVIKQQNSAMEDNISICSLCHQEYDISLKDKQSKQPKTNNTCSKCQEQQGGFNFLTVQEILKPKKLNQLTTHLRKISQQIQSQDAVSFLSRSRRRAEDGSMMDGSFMDEDGKNSKKSAPHRGHYLSNDSSSEPIQEQNMFMQSLELIKTAQNKKMFASKQLSNVSVIDIAVDHWDSNESIQKFNNMSHGNIIKGEDKNNLSISYNDHEDYQQMIIRDSQLGSQPSKLQAQYSGVKRNRMAQIGRLDTWKFNSQISSLDQPHLLHIQDISDIKSQNQEQSKKQKIISVVKGSTILTRSPKKQYLFLDYACDICENTPIKDKRYHCKQCEDYDLCEECYHFKRTNHFHSQFIEIKGSNIHQSRQKQVKKLQESKRFELKMSKI